METPRGAIYKPAGRPVVSLDQRVGGWAKGHERQTEKMRLVSSSIPLAAVMLLSLPSLQAQACPDCPEGIRKQVRAGIFDETFVANVGMAALPFGVLAAITAALHVGLPSRRRRHG